MEAVRKILQRGDRLCGNLLAGWRRAVLVAMIFIAGFVCCGAYSVKLGPINNWDLKNYQYYSPYALLTGRYDFDYAPAQIQTFLNPVPFVPFYVATKIFKPVAAGFVMGGIHGLAAGLLFLTAMAVFSGMPSLPRIVLSLLCTVLGMYGPTFLPYLGGSGSDNMVALFILAGVYVLVRALRRHGVLDSREARPALLMGGILIGIAAGLKLVCLLFVIGHCAAVLVTSRRILSRLATLGLSGAACILGIIISRGHWMTFLWSRFGSPLFPFYNKIFQSPYYYSINFADDRFIPKTLKDAVLLPFHFISDTRFTRISQDFRDLRYALVYALFLLCLILLAAGLVMVLLRRPHLKNRLADRTEIFLLVFFAVSYIVWQTNFAVMRYIVPLELLAPILIIALLRLLLPWKAAHMIATIAAFASIAVFMHPSQIEHRSWSSAYIDVKAPQFSNPDETLVIIASNKPLSYVIPAFQPGVRFVGLANTFSRLDRKHHKSTKEILNVIESHSGPLYILTERYRTVAESIRIHRRRMIQISEECIPIETKNQRHPPCLWRGKIK